MKGGGIMCHSFLGEYQYNMDSKGRLIMPADFREAFQDEFVITKGYDPCIFVFTSKAWQKFESNLNQLSMYDRDARNLLRFFFGGAARCFLDRQGRIKIPTHLLTYAKITKEAKITGISDRLEIWNPTALDEINNVDAAKLATQLTAEMH